MYYECSLQSLNQLCTVHLEMSGAPSASVINWQNIYLDLLNRNNGNIFLDDINIEDLSNFFLSAYIFCLTNCS